MDNLSFIAFPAIQILLPIIFTALVIWVTRYLDLIVTTQLVGSSYKRSLSFRSFIVGGWMALLKSQVKELLLSRGKLQFRRVLTYALILPLSMLPLLLFPLCEVITKNEGILRSEIISSEYSLLLIIGAVILGTHYRFILEFFSSRNGNGSDLIAKHGGVLINIHMVLICILLSTLAIYQSLSLQSIIQQQMAVLVTGVPLWGIWRQPLGMILFFALLVIQYETNCSSLSLSNRWGAPLSTQTGHSLFEKILIKLSSEIQLVMQSLLFVTIFLGGYSLLPFFGWITYRVSELYHPLQVVSLLIKTILTMVFFRACSMYIIKSKLTGQVEFLWRYLIPLGLANLIIVILYVMFSGV
jgi:NADH-quinone oxidoreductase subunit H